MQTLGIAMDGASVGIRPIKHVCGQDGIGASDVSRDRARLNEDRVRDLRTKPRAVVTQWLPLPLGRSGSAF